MANKTSRKADQPLDLKGRQYHIALSSGQIPPVVLIPGDPARIDKLKKYWETPVDLSHNREFRSARGMIHGTPIGAISVGVGMGGVEVALNELATIGVHTIIRVGTTGALLANIACGEVIIPVAGLRRDGVSDVYAEPGFPAFAHPDVLSALMESCNRLQVRYHLGITCTVGSFYLGQGRPIHNGYFKDQPTELVDHLVKLGITNFDMETAGVFVLSHLMGLRAASILAVIANRATNQFADAGGEELVCKLATESVAILQEQDTQKKNNPIRPVSTSLAKGPVVD